MHKIWIEAALNGPGVASFSHAGRNAAGAGGGGVEAN
jgi:hypothetical protein